jgi:uncharacterized protein YecE (DUF72 family)
LRQWAKRVKKWTSDGRDAYVYFDNDAKGRAPHDALELGRIVGADGRTA